MWRVKTWKILNHNWAYRGEKRDFFFFACINIFLVNIAAFRQSLYACPININYMFLWCLCFISNIFKFSLFLHSLSLPYISLLHSTKKQNLLVFLHHLIAVFQANLYCKYNLILCSFASLCVMIPFEIFSSQEDSIYYSYNIDPKINSSHLSIIHFTNFPLTSPIFWFIWVRKKEGTHQSATLMR